MFSEPQSFYPDNFLVCRSSRLFQWMFSIYELYFLSSSAVMTCQKQKAYAPSLAHINTASGFTKTFHRGQKRSLSCHVDLTYFSFLSNSTSPWFLTHLIISFHLGTSSSSMTAPHGSYLTLLISTFPLQPFYLHLLTSISYIMSVASL